MNQLEALQAQQSQQVLQALQAQLNRVIVGKHAQIKLALACLLANGHLLIEDVPGVGKTTLALALAKSLGLSFNRVQFTSDLMPSDLVGVSTFDRAKDAWVYHAGPLFTQVLLADEINRASPKTQSALLEAMEERQVSAEGQTRPLPSPFFVIATQNPREQAGTQALPESQLDRFLMCLSLGYPDAASERQLLTGTDTRQVVNNLTAVMGVQDLVQMQGVVDAVTVSEALLDYLQRLVAASRSGLWFAQGLSPRAVLVLLRSAKAYALLQKRNYVTPDDLKALAAPCMAHRLVALDKPPRTKQEQLQAMVESIAL